MFSFQHTFVTRSCILSLLQKLRQIGVAVIY